MTTEITTNQTDLFSCSQNLSHGMFDEMWFRAYNDAGGIMGAAGHDQAQAVSLLGKTYDVSFGIETMDAERNLALVKATARRQDDGAVFTAYLRWQGDTDTFAQVNQAWSERDTGKQPASGDPGVNVRGTWVQVDGDFIQRVVTEKAVNPFGSVWSDEELAPVVRSVNLYTLHALPKAVVDAMARHGFVTSHHLFKKEELAPSGATVYSIENPEDYGWSADLAVGYISELRQLDIILGKELMESERYFHQDRRAGVEKALRELLLAAKLEWQMLPGGYRKTWCFNDKSELLGQFLRHCVCYHTMVDEENPVEYNVRF